MILTIQEIHNVSNWVSLKMGHQESLGIEVKHRYVYREMVACLLMNVRVFLLCAPIIF